MSDRHTHAWAWARFLKEAMGPAKQDQSSETLISDVVVLVERLYARYEQAMSGDALDPLGALHSMDFLMADISYDLCQRTSQASPLCDAQDTEISEFRGLPDPDQPMLRGMITVRANFANFA